MTANDARECPLCGTRGILPLDQERQPGGGFSSPVMICPADGNRWEATGFSVKFFSIRSPQDFAAAQDELMDGLRNEAE